MKIWVLSDTHGQLLRVYEVYKTLKDIDYIIHLGDYNRDVTDMQKHIDIPIISVKGNCDGALNKEDSSKIISLADHNILCTHGHMDGVNYDITNLMYRSLENECDIALFGHTHIPYNEYANGVYLINPGSINKPRDGSHGSYAILTLDEEKSKNDTRSVNCEIVYYKHKSKLKTGYVSSILNYSDRF